MLGRAHFSQKQLHGLNQSQIKEKLIREKDVVWEDLPKECRYGSTIFDDEVDVAVFIRNREFIKKFLEPEP